MGRCWHSGNSSNASIRISWIGAPFAKNHIERANTDRMRHKAQTLAISILVQNSSIPITRGIEKWEYVRSLSIGTRRIKASVRGLQQKFRIQVLKQSEFFNQRFEFGTHRRKSIVK